MTPDISETAMKIDVPTGPNRAQRRTLARHRKREERAKHRLALLRSVEAMMDYLASVYMQCPRCKLCFLDGSLWRCQCQVEQLRQCAICHRAFMVSQRKWRETNICAQCIDQLQMQRENEEASRSVAYDAWHERRAWDDEQHRQAMESR